MDSEPFKINARESKISRNTNETNINIQLLLDSTENQSISVDTGIGFLDHVIAVNCIGLND